MRHGKKFNHLGRTASHRKAMLSNMASSLIQHKRISTTVAKAKALRKYVEPLITKAKTDSTHSRRVVFSYLQDKESVTTLFSEVADKVASRAGGYTRIIKTGNRLGDNADMCIIELVDYNENLLKEAAPKKKRSRRGGKKKATEETPAVEAQAEEAVVETPEEDVQEAAAEVEVKEETPEAAVEAEAVVEEAAAEEPVAEAAEEETAEAGDEAPAKEEDTSEEEKKDEE